MLINVFPLAISKENLEQVNNVRKGVKMAENINSEKTQFQTLACLAEKT